jgi:hypothetical protein
VKHFQFGILLAAATVAWAPIPQARADVLWDQPYDGSSGSIVSQVFPDLPAFSTKSFDDFVVTGGWNINSVTIFGVEAGNPAANVAVALSITAVPDFNAPPIAFALGTEVGANLAFTGLSIDLAPGTYWISAWVNRPFAGGGQWFWEETLPVQGSQFFVHNPGGGFGFGTTPVPGTVVTGDGPHDLAFQIQGSVVPEPGTLTLLGLGTLGLLGLGRRYRKQAV